MDAISCIVSVHSFTYAVSIRCIRGTCVFSKLSDKGTYQLNPKLSPLLDFKCI